MACIQACQDFKEEQYAREKTSALRQLEAVDDPLTAIARDRALRMLAAALSAEADAVVKECADVLQPDARPRVV